MSNNRGNEQNNCSLHADLACVWLADVTENDEEILSLIKVEGELAIFKTTTRSVVIGHSAKTCLRRAISIVDNPRLCTEVYYSVYRHID